MIKAVIFDLDGLLIESEHLWNKVMHDCFLKYNFNLTTEDYLLTMGMRIDEIIEKWKNERNLICDEKKLEADIFYGMVEAIKSEAVIRPGAKEIFPFFKEKNLPLAIASTSPEIIIKAGVEKLGIVQHLSAIASAEHELKGKPDPAVYLTAARKISISPENCLAFEDSANGLLAAKAAGMKVVAIPDPLTNLRIVEEKADLILSSLLEFNEASFNKLNT